MALIHTSTQSRRQSAGREITASGLARNPGRIDWAFVTKFVKLPAILYIFITKRISAFSLSTG
jgi:hypothetical protein